MKMPLLFHLIITIVLVTLRLDSVIAQEIEFHRNAESRIRLASPPFSKDREVYENKTTIGKCVSNSLAQHQQSLKIYADTHENEISLTIVVQEEHDFHTLAAVATGELMRFILDSDIDCGSITLHHGESWELSDAKIRMKKRRLGKKLAELKCCVRSVERDDEGKGDSHSSKEHKKVPEEQEAKQEQNKVPRAE